MPLIVISGSIEDVPLRSIMSDTLSSILARQIKKQLEINSIREMVKIQKAGGF